MVHGPWARDKGPGTEPACVAKQQMNYMQLIERKFAKYFHVSAPLCVCVLFVCVCVWAIMVRYDDGYAQKRIQRLRKRRVCTANLDGLCSRFLDTFSN